MAEIQAAASKRAKPDDGAFRLSRPRPRVGVRIDMTPMVDVAFLLLIFFMVTTVFRRPLAMEVNMPDPDAKIEVPQSNVMTLVIEPDESMRWWIGTGAETPITERELEATFRESVRQNPDLVILVKIHRKARYERMVDMLDTLADADVQRFSLIPLEEEEPPQG
jgi:biopolymer transport protein ExbD